MESPNWLKINEKKRNEILLGQAINIAAQRSIESIDWLIANPIQFKARVKSMYYLLQEIRKEVGKNEKWVE
jgi:hypothetical protein